MICEKSKSTTFLYYKERQKELTKRICDESLQEWALNSRIWPTPANVFVEEEQKSDMFHVSSSEYKKVSQYYIFCSDV